MNKRNKKILINAVPIGKDLLKIGVRELIVANIDYTFQRRSIQPYIPQGHLRENSMGQAKFISYPKTETWTSYLLDQLFLI